MEAWNDELLAMNKLLGSRDRAKRHASNFDFALSISPCLLLQRGGIFWTPQQRLEIRSSKSKRSAAARRSGIEGRGNSHATRHYRHRAKTPITSKKGRYPGNAPYGRVRGNELLTGDNRENGGFFKTHLRYLHCLLSSFVSPRHSMLPTPSTAALDACAVRPHGL
jgi:hypothetical protein